MQKNCFIAIVFIGCLWSFSVFYSVPSIAVVSQISSTQQTNNMPFFSQGANSAYSPDWVRRMNFACQVKDFADNSEYQITLENAALIKLVLGDINLYLIRLPDLVEHIFSNFLNNSDFQQFSLGDKAETLFDFLLYLQNLKDSDKDAFNKLLENNFNMYEVVSINRILSENLKEKIYLAKELMRAKRFTNKSLADLATDYAELRANEENFIHTDNMVDESFLTCVNNGSASKDFRTQLRDCLQEFKGDKNIFLTGVRMCYLHGIDNIKNQQIMQLDLERDGSISKYVINLNDYCKDFVNDYLNKYTEEKLFLQRHVAFLIYYHLLVK